MNLKNSKMSTTEGIKLTHSQNQILDICTKNISCFTSLDRRRQILPLIADVCRHQKEVDIFFQSLQPAFKTLDMMTMAIENEMDAKRYVQPDGLSKLRSAWKQKLLIQCKNLNSNKQSFVYQIFGYIHQDYSEANKIALQNEQALAAEVSAEITEFYKQQLQKMPTNSNEKEESIRSFQNSLITAFEKSLTVQTNPAVYQQQLAGLRNALKNCEATNTNANLIQTKMNPNFIFDSRTEDTKKGHPSINESWDTAVVKTEPKEKRRKKNSNYHKNCDETNKTANSTLKLRDQNFSLEQENTLLKKHTGLYQLQPKDFENNNENSGPSKLDNRSAQKSPSLHRKYIPKVANRFEIPKSGQPSLKSHANQTKEDPKVVQIPKKASPPSAQEKSVSQKRQTPENEHEIILAIHIDYDTIRWQWWRIPEQNHFADNKSRSAEILRNQICFRQGQIYVTDSLEVINEFLISNSGGKPQGFGTVTSYSIVFHRILQLLKTKIGPGQVKVKECVIAVNTGALPSYRLAIKMAANLTGLKKVRIINETTASAILYLTCNRTVNSVAIVLSNDKIYQKAYFERLKSDWKHLNVSLVAFQTSTFARDDHNAYSFATVDKKTLNRWELLTKQNSVSIGGKEWSDTGANMPVLGALLYAHSMHLGGQEEIRIQETLACKIDVSTGTTIPENWKFPYHPLPLMIEIEGEISDIPKDSKEISFNVKEDNQVQCWTVSCDEEFWDFLHWELWLDRNGIFQVKLQK